MLQLKSSAGARVCRDAPPPFGTAPAAVEHATVQLERAPLEQKPVSRAHEQPGKAERQLWELAKQKLPTPPRKAPLGAVTSEALYELGCGRKVGATQNQQ